MKAKQHRPLVHWLSVAAIVLLSACGAGSVDEPETGAPATEGAGPQTANACGTAAFPCSLASVPQAVLVRSDELADELLRRLNQGASMAELLAFVRGQAGVVDAAVGTSALRFRLAGGRDVLIIDPPLPSAAAKAAAAEAAMSAAMTAQPPLAAAPETPASERKFAQAAAGDGSAQKRALVLSPFKYQFAPFDDGAAVAQRLLQTRGYAGQVSYHANNTRTAASVGIEQFAGWEQFDVIHVSSHGARVCDVNRCLSVILTGDIYSNASDLLRLTEAGLNTARVRGSDDRLLALGPDYFKQHYPGGLSRKIIFLNACETFDLGGEDLGAALRGPQSVYLGWTDAVESDAATNAALALYRGLSDHGVTTAAALDKLGPLAVNQYRHHSRDINATLRAARDTAGDLRLREVVTIERLPAGGMLPPGASVAVVGTANDGVVDHVAYRVLVEGIPLAQQDAAVMQFRVDSHASSTPQAVTIGERVGDTGWRLFGQIPFVDVTPQQQVEMVATVQLPEGGSSEHRVTVKLTADPPGVGETWVGEAVHHFDETTPQGQVHVTRVASVTFKQLPSTIGGRYKVLRSVGGRMTWSRSGTVKTALDGHCAYSFGPVEVAMADGDGELIIDTSEALHPYALSGFTQGAEVRLAENCGAYAFSTRAGGAWAPALAAGDGHRASADGREISGVTGNDSSAWTWRFRRQ